MDDQIRSSAQSELDLHDQIELLVEGELPTDARSRLLLTLESKPELWRSLALAFVEHQSVRGTIRKVCRQEQLETRYADANTDEGLLAVAARGRASGKRWTVGLTLAGCGILVMLSLLSVELHEGLTEPVSVSPTHTNQVPSTDPVQELNEPADDNDEVEADSAVDGAVAGYIEWVGRNGKTLSPVFRGREVDLQWLQSNPPQVSERMQKALARVGWEITPARRFVSLTLSEGGQFMIPMDDISYRFVGKNVF